MDKESRLGKQLASFRPKTSEFYAGVILAILVTGGGIALGIFVMLGVIRDGADGWNFVLALAWFALSFIALPWMGWGMFQLGKDMASMSDAVEIYEHGLIARSGNRPKIILWSEITRIEKEAEKSSMPVLNYGLLNATTWVRTYRVICEDGTQHVFSTSTNTGIRKIVAHLKQACEDYSIPWKEVIKE